MNTITIEQIPENLRPWLVDKGSLTHKLRQLTDGRIKLHLKQEGWLCPSADETLILGSRADEKALIREIEWVLDGNVWVSGRVVIPKASTMGRGEQFTTLGSGSLGDILFTDPDLKRDDFVFYKSQNQHGRYSVFQFYGLPVLVCERFCGIQFNASHHFQAQQDSSSSASQ